MMHYLVVYRLSSGEILSALERQHDDNYSPVVDPAFGVVASEDMLSPTAFYILNGSAAPRPASPITLSKPVIAADGTDVATFSNIPVGAECRVLDVNGAHRYVITDGVLELTSSIAGQATVEVRHFPHLDYTATVTAV